MNRYRLVFLFLFGVVVAACAPEAQTRRDPGFASLTPRAAAPADVLVTTRTQAPQLTPTPDSSQAPVGESDTESGVQYAIKAVLNWQTHAIQIEQKVVYRNQTGRPQNYLVFSVEPNHEPDHFVIQRITTGTNTAITDYELSGTQLLVSLPERLLIGDSVELTLNFDLVLPPIENMYGVGYWGYGPRQVNLGMWFPLVAAYDPSLDWITPAFWSIGEHFALRMADFTVELQVIGASKDVRVAGPGERTRVNETTWRFELAGGREVALSISEGFKTLSTVTENNVKVDLFYFPDPVADSLDAPRHTLEVAADALTLYEDLYGPYPHARLAVVEGDFPDGMEFSGLVFVSGDWFRTWQGIPNDWLTLITAHEVAHQWWYALVGNDQGNYPYMDEALAIYSEALFLEHYYPDYVDWWWNFRIGNYNPSGYVDSRVYEFSSLRGYINAVYLRGALMMQALRTDLGDREFFAWLQGYTEQMKGQLATPSDFWGMLPENEYAATKSTRDLYLRQSDVLMRSNELP